MWGLLPREAEAGAQQGESAETGRQGQLRGARTWLNCEGLLVVRGPVCLPLMGLDGGLLPASHRLGASGSPG